MSTFSRKKKRIKARLDEPAFRVRMRGVRSNEIEQLRFVKRAQARQWCRNHYFSVPSLPLLIVHPDETVEEFTWAGATLGARPY